MLESDSYDAQMKAVREKLKSAAKKTDSEVLTYVANKEEKSSNKEEQARCQMFRMITNEALEQYEEGDMSWDEMLEDMMKALKAI